MQKIKGDKWIILEKNLLNNPNFIFFSGAGTSFYTKMPSGNELSRKLYKLAGASMLDRNNWQATSQKVEDIYGRSELIKMLKNIFNTDKISNKKYHDELINSLMLKSIYTLNYDDLFEKNNFEKVNVIYDFFQISEQEENKINIFKLHGDLNNSESVVITENDYKKFNRNLTKNPSIDELKVDLRKNIVIISGTSFSDEHFQKIFVMLKKQLGNYRKKIFYLYCELSEEEKIICEKLDIIPIQSKFEEFVQWIIKIEKNKMPEIKDKVSKNKLCEKFPKASIEKGHVNLEDNINGVILILEEKEKAEQLKKFINGIGKELSLDDVCIKYKYGDILIKNIEKAKISLKHNPNYEYKGSLKISDGIIENTEIKIYSLIDELDNKPIIEINIFFNSVLFEMKLKFNEVTGELKIEFNIEFTGKIESYNYFLGIEKFVKFITSKFIKTIDTENKELNMDQFKEIVDSDIIQNVIKNLNFSLKYIKPITEKSILEFNDFEGQNYKDIVELKRYLDGKIIYKNKEIKNLSLKIIDIEKLKEKKEIKLDGKFNSNFKLKNIFIYKINKKYLEFESYIKIKTFKAKIVDDQLKIIPESDIRVEYKLINQGIEGELDEKSLGDKA